jgi:hypothetical protein
MIRDVAIRAFRLEEAKKDAHVRVLIRPKLRVKVGDAPATPAGGPAFIREVNCKLNGNLVIGMEAGPHLNEEAFFEFVVRAGVLTPGRSGSRLRRSPATTRRAAPQAVPRRHDGSR